MYGRPRQVSREEFAGLMAIKIVLTGAPASGKTDIFQRLEVSADYATFVFLEEQARRLLTNNPEYRNDWPAFHREIYRRQVLQEQDLTGRSFVTDRGTVDAFAFHPETVADVGTSIPAEYARYTDVIQLGTSAALGEAFFPRDAIRTESMEDALAIEAAITDVWKRHPGYRFFPAEVDYEVKVKQVLAYIGTLMSRR